jgi:hypothetical protein
MEMPRRFKGLPRLDWSQLAALVSSLHLLRYDNDCAGAVRLSAIAGWALSLFSLMFMSCSADALVALKACLRHVASWTLWVTAVTSTVLSSLLRVLLLLMAAGTTPI